MVNVRPLGCSTDTSLFAERIQALRCQPAEATRLGEWSPVPLEEVIASVDGSAPTIVFVHGNRVESCEIRPRSLWAYSKLLEAGCDDRPIRFIVFSWPADEVDGLLRDTRIKAARTKPAGFQLAWLLNQTDPQAPLGLLGYSYGARIVSGATHLLAGGSLGRLSLPGCSACADRPTRAVYMAPAFDANWLARGGYHSLSLHLTDSILMATNRRDPAMKFYPLLNPQSRPQAMGYEGPTSLPRELRYRVRLMDVAAPVGRHHDMCEYMSVRGFMTNAWRRLTFADQPATAVAHAAGDLSTR